MWPFVRPLWPLSDEVAGGRVSAAGSQGGACSSCRDGGEGLPTAAQLRDAQSGGRVGKMVPVVSHWAGRGRGGIHARGRKR